MAEAEAARPSATGVGRAAATRSRHIALLAWFLISAVVYLANDRVGGSGDSAPAALIPVAVMLDGTLMLDRFSPAAHQRDPHPYWLVATPSGWASFYPVATGIIALPVLALPILVQEWRRPLSAEAWLELATGPYQKVAAALIAALSVALFWVAVRTLGCEPAPSVLLTAYYAFGSETMAVSSQSLLQQAPGCAMLFGAISCLAALKRRPMTSAVLLGLCLGMALAIRPTNLVFAAPLLLLALRRSPQLVPLVILTAAIAVSPFAAYNLKVFGTPLGGYGSNLAQITFANLVDHLAGVLFSPARGLVPYFPVALLTLILLLLRPAIWRNGLALALAAGVVFQVCLIAAWDVWWGGHSFGPRLLTEAQGPILLLAGLAFPTRLPGRRAAMAALGCMMAWSTLAQLTYVYSNATAMWSAEPTNVDQDRARLWDFVDNPVSRAWRGPPGR